jgi:uncharacterized protein YhbP (UPF0306 family)
MAGRGFFRRSGSRFFARVLKHQSTCLGLRSEGGCAMKLANIRTYDTAGKEISRRLGEKHLRRIALRILQENVLCAMATVSAECGAHINKVYFCYSDEFEIFFLSHPNSTHGRNVSRKPSMAMAVFSSSQQWVGPDRGLQLFGVCSQAKGSHLAKAGRLYAKRFSAYASWKVNREQGDPAREYQFYRFVVRRLKILDEVHLGEAVFVTVDVQRI